MPALVCAPGGPPLAGRRGALDLIGRAMAGGAGLVVVPVDRLGEDFFSLRTGVAAGIAGTFADQGVRLAIVGDVSPRLAASTSLRDFVEAADHEGRIVCAGSFPTLAARLTPLP
nr:DUF4180 domain-containing protein [Streptomyces ficellus]